MSSSIKMACLKAGEAALEDMREHELVVVRNIVHRGLVTFVRVVLPHVVVHVLDELVLLRQCLCKRLDRHISPVLGDDDVILLHTRKL
eukprot:CAMPEP_0180280910 /NCGR_PEP_ID=MMETSP0988-20121125/8909_1 /TAXON_ID=697907 /ORGANISM="non described non described, Strain CCMP2293" /LENGTH=87 /DNA_ID=CAMNT_0022252837 /DNA_START=1132 /DNA_END=1394 /DNA_ORIENTATION=-